MPIDSSIYFQQQTPDIMGSIEKGLSMRQMLDERKKQQGIKDAYKAGMVTAPDGFTTGADGTVSNVPGATTFNPKLTANALLGVDPQAYEAFKSKTDAQALQEQQLKKQKLAEHAQYMSNALDFMGDSVPGIGPVTEEAQKKYTHLRTDAQKQGYDISAYPEQWGAEAFNKLKFDAGGALDAHQRVQHQEKVRELDQKGQEIEMTGKRDENTVAHQKATVGATYAQIKNQKEMNDANIAKAKEIEGMKSEREIAKDTKNKQYDSMKTYNSAVSGSRQQADAVKELNNVLSFRNINEITTQAPEGDLNKLNNQQTKLVMMELVKMAGGSVPTEGELKTMTPDGFAQKYGGLMQKITNKSQPANAGEFIQQGIAYARGIARNSAQNLTKRSYEISDRLKPQMSEDGYGLVRKQADDEFKDVMAPSDEERAAEKRRQQEVQAAFDRQNNPQPGQTASGGFSNPIMPSAYADQNKSVAPPVNQVFHTSQIKWKK